MRIVSGFIILLAIAAPSARCVEVLSPEAIRGAIEAALPRLNSAARISAEKRKCFTCHNEGLPMLVFVRAKENGYQVDPDIVSDLAAHTAAHLKRGKSNYLKGIGQGGKADTAGSALWALDAAGYPRDEVTDAVIGFLIQRNADTPYWAAQSNRPPSEGSRFTSTFLALRGLDGFSFDEQQEAIEKRRTAARDWLIETEPKTTEDRVFRLRTLALAGAEKSHLKSASGELLATQRDDGGWAQLPDLQSDAYATGSALVALRETEQLSAASDPYQRGLKFLLDTQQDGTWHVVSRSKPIQEHYDTGFPWGKDQFISAAGSSWATLALLHASSGVSKRENAP